MNGNRRSSLGKILKLGLSSILAPAIQAQAFPKNKFTGQTVHEPNQIVYLWEENSSNDLISVGNRARLELFLPVNHDKTKPVPAVIVCPGGGYGKLAPHEGAPLAQLFAANGMAGLVLYYRHFPNLYPAPYADAARAMRLLRSKSADLGIQPNKIAIMGFSAGGHLASTLATQPNRYFDPADNLASEVSARPDRVILAYPVISFTKFQHQGSVNNFLGPNPNSTLTEQFSSEKQVTPNSPPAFLFHTFDDKTVPVENSMAYAEACAANKVPFALHIFPSGRHGVGMALNEPQTDLKTWIDILLVWLKGWG